MITAPLGAVSILVLGPKLLESNGAVVEDDSDSADSQPEKKEKKEKDVESSL